MGLKEEYKKKWKKGELVNIEQPFRENLKTVQVSSWENVLNRVNQTISQPIQTKTLSPEIQSQINNLVNQSKQVNTSGLQNARLNKQTLATQMATQNAEPITSSKQTTKEGKKKLQEDAYQYKQEKEKGKIFQTPKSFADNDVTGYELFDTAKAVGGTLVNIPAKILEGATKVNQEIGNLGSYAIADIIDTVNKDENHTLRKRVQKGVEDDNTFWQNYEKKTGSQYSILGTRSQGALEGVGQSGVYAGANLASPALSTAMIIGSSAGSSLSETYQENPDIKSWQAWLRAGGHGVTSGATENIFKVFGVGGSGIDDALKNEISKQFNNGFAKWAVRTGISAGGEGAEEGIEYFADFGGCKYKIQ